MVLKKQAELRFVDMIGLYLSTQGIFKALCVCVCVFLILTDSKCTFSLYSLSIYTAYPKPSVGFASLPVWNCSSSVIPE